MNQKQEFKVLLLFYSEKHAQTIEDKLHSICMYMNIFKASEYEDLVAALNKTHYDLIITSEQIQSCSRQFLMTLFKTYQKSVPVVMYSEFSDESLIAEALKSGSANYFSIQYVERLEEICKQELLGQNNIGYKSDVLEKEKNYQLLSLEETLMHLPDAVFILDFKGRIYFVNDDARKLISSCDNRYRNKKSYTGFTLESLGIVSPDQKSLFQKSSKIYD